MSDGFFDTEDDSSDPIEVMEDVSGDDAPRARRTRESSAIDFPYIDLDQAIQLPETIHRNFGTKCLPEQLSAAIDLRGGAFTRRTGGARMFGLIERDGEVFRITELGRRIVSNDQSAHARVEAFLNVELYRRLYEDFRGTTLPADGGIENHMRELGVPQKQLEGARQVFRRAARQAGFFAFGEDRLIMPAIRDDAPRTTPSRTPEADPKTDVPAVVELKALEAPARPVSPSGLHPLIAALIHDIPTEETWEQAKFSRWMDTFEAMAKYVYNVERKTGA